MTCHLLRPLMYCRNIILTFLSAGNQGMKFPFPPFKPPWKAKGHPPQPPRWILKRERLAMKRVTVTVQIVILTQNKKLSASVFRPTTIVIKVSFSAKKYILLNKDCLNTQGTVYNHFIRTIYTACPLKIKFNSPIKKKVMWSSLQLLSYHWELNPRP